MLRTTLITLALTPAALGATHQVSPAQNIQAVINGATDGDVVELMPGTFQQVFEINGKSLTIRSADPGNPATVDGVALGSVIRVIAPSGPTVIEHLTITGGDAVTGGGLYIENGLDVFVRNCMFDGNVCDNPGGGLRATGTDLVEITGCTFRDNQATIPGADGGGFYIDNGAVTVRDCLFEDNAAADSGAALRVDAVSPAQVTDCTFLNNSVSNNGGAIFLRSGTVLTVDACRFVGNSAEHGGALYAWTDAGSALLRNCVFQANTASAAGGAFWNDDQITVLNSTFEGNAPNAVDGASSPSTTVRNSILWNNGGTPITHGAVTWSTVEFGYAGTGNRDADPLFVDAAGGDLSLQDASPAIDAADSRLYCGPAVDLALNDRGVEVYAEGFTFGRSEIGPVIDMGAYEYQTDEPDLDTCPADTNGDDEVDVEDLVNVITAWGLCP